MHSLLQSSDFKIDGNSRCLPVFLSTQPWLKLEFALRYGGSPLHYATSQGHQNVVELLLNMGADSNLANKGGCTPLHLAAISNNEDIVKLLINKGANPNVADMNGKTPIHFTEINGQKDVVKMLLDAGADMYQQEG